MLCNVAIFFKTGDSKVKTPNNSWICSIVVSTCKFLFCNNLLTKFIAWALAVPVLALRTETVYLCRCNRDGIGGRMGKLASHCWGHCCYPSRLRGTSCSSGPLGIAPACHPQRPELAHILLPGVSSLLTCMLHVSSDFTHKTHVQR